MATTTATAIIIAIYHHQEEAARVQQARIRVEADLRQVGRQHKDVLELKVQMRSVKWCTCLRSHSAFSTRRLLFLFTLNLIVILKQILCARVTHA